MSKNEVTVYGEEKALSVGDVKRQVNLIQEVLTDVMKDGEHYGKIPGCGKKPALLKPGAEKIIMTFRLVPDIHQEVFDMPNSHREYRTKVNLSTQAGIFLGSGVGSCSTMEGKYRFRTGEVTKTGKPVPPDYWNERNANPKKAQASIGGIGFSTKKIDGNWEIVMQGEKVEHDNPADNYNTCLKMSKKRALVDAVLTVTAASDIFEQDIDETLTQGDSEPETTPQTPSGGQKPPDKKKASAEQGKLWAVLVELHGNDPAKIKATLLEVTSFVAKKDGKKYKKGDTVPGKESIYDVSDAACKVARHQVEKLVEDSKDALASVGIACNECAAYDICEIERGSKDEPCQKYVPVEAPQ